MSLSLHTIDWSGLDEPARKRLLQRPLLDERDRGKAVSEILERVRREGDAALAELTQRLDGVAAQSLAVEPDEVRVAVERIDPGLRTAIREAAGRIETFHAADRPQDRRVETAAGLVCEVRYQPLNPVGLYVPGGSAPLVSTVLMLAIPARLAGCADIVICSPPDRRGQMPDEILAAAALCGVSRVFCVGGAQAIAAMAYGTETVPRCAKLFGPGNAWVTEAKQQVAADPRGAAIDLPAGPSEVLVIADGSAQAEHVAWDLLSQAEHGPDSQVVLLTDSPSLAREVIAAVERLLPQSPRRAILERALGAARVIRVENLETAVALSNEYAPEHLILNTVDAATLADSVRNAGSVFIGPWTPESLGDYCSGTNHVLPTYGWARAHGALGLGDFMRRTTFQQASAEALQQVGPCAEALAASEGLDAHRMAVRARLVTIGGAEREKA